MTRLSDRGRMIAALIAAGPGAALSHRTAAYLWKLIPSMPPFVDVTFTDRVPEKRERTCESIERQRLDTTIHQRLHDRPPRPDDRAAPARAARPCPSRGAGPRSLIPRTADDHAEPTRSELERALLPALERAQLPAPARATTTCSAARSTSTGPTTALDRRDRRLAHPRAPAGVRVRPRPRRDAAGAGYGSCASPGARCSRETLLVTVRIAQLLAARRQCDLVTQCP